MSNLLRLLKNFKTIHHSINDIIIIFDDIKNDDTKAENTHRPFLSTHSFIYIFKIFSKSCDLSDYFSHALSVRY
jgi:hypothetical protein